MLIILILILSIVTGISIGYLLRHKGLKAMDRIVTVWICILLFLIGIEVGGNEQLLKHLHLLGYKALVVAIATTMGAILMSALLWCFIRKSQGKKGKCS